MRLVKASGCQNADKKNENPLRGKVRAAGAVAGTSKKTRKSLLTREETNVYTRHASLYSTVDDDENANANETDDKEMHVALRKTFAGLGNLVSQSQKVSGGAGGRKRDGGSNASTGTASASSPLPKKKKRSSCGKAGGVSNSNTG